MRTPKPDRRSPLKDPPLRQAGQSVAEELDEHSGAIMAEAVVGLFAVALAAFEWYRYYFDPTPHPWTLTACALLACAYSAYRIRPMLTHKTHLKQGKQGEIFVGQMLEELREDGFKVLHDVLGPNFNIDHVLIGPKGIYTVETKTWGKIAHRPDRVHYDGHKITADGYPAEADPIPQSKAQAAGLMELIQKQTGKHFAVQPIVLFPGWFVDPLPPHAEVLVLNPKSLRNLLASRRNALPTEDIDFIYARLADYVRTSTRAG
jgi:hypothetical protein